MGHRLPMRIKPAITFKIAAQHGQCIQPPEDMATHLPCGHAKHTRLARLLGIRTQPLLGFVTCFVIALLLLQQGAQALQALRVIGIFTADPTRVSKNWHLAVAVTSGLWGGLIIGVFMHGLGLGEAAQNYTLLSIGDALVSQIPALVISMAAGIVISNVSTGQDIGRQLVGELVHLLAECGHGPGS